MRADLPGAKALRVPLFGRVIVVTDRRPLDKQLPDNIRDFSEVKNIVAPAMRSADLKSALENGNKIIITTIQKFAFASTGSSIMNVSDGRLARLNRVTLPSRVSVTTTASSAPLMDAVSQT